MGAGLTLLGVEASTVEHEGRRALRLVEPGGARRGGLAILQGSDFGDGTIELELAARPGAAAAPDDRGFAGIGFRLAPGGERGELVWLRPTNGRADDQVRRNHSTQYASMPDWPWYRLREESPGRYESYVDLEPGAWTRMRVVVAGARAELYVHDAPQPCLVVTDLKLGRDARGAVGLWIGAGTEAFFTGLRVV
jgi:hypothetical protein